MIFPDGTPRDAKGPQTFSNAAPGNYRVKPTPLPLYTIGMVASPQNMTLAPGEQLAVRVTF